MPTYCPTCGTSNPDDAKTCHYCDTSLARFASDGALASGTLINYRYRITKLIKAGGMGAVYLAKDLKKNQIRAVKELFKQFSPQEEQYVVQRFKEEAGILSKLRYPNLPRVTDYFHDYDRYYLVMDYIQGDDLEAILEEEGEPGLPELDVVDWAVQICGVLDYLHSQNPPILYRDTKPSNIMIRYEDGTAMLIDFGLARTIQPGSEKGKTAIGTEGYSPPEQYMGNPEPRSDVYALGATMHHLLTGEFPAVPFQFSYVRDLNPDVSEELEAIVMKALEIEIDDRYSSAKEMQDVLLQAYPVAYERIEYLSGLSLDKEEPEEPEEPDEEAEIVEIIEEVERDLSEIKIEEKAKPVPETVTYHSPQKSPVKAKPDIKMSSREKDSGFMALINQLNSGDIKEKQNTVRKIGEEGDKRAVPFLIELLEYKNKDLTGEVIKALGSLKDSSAVTVLIKLLDNPDPIIKQLSAVALGDIRDLRALSPLIKALTRGDVGTRASAAYSLGNLGDKDAIEPLLDAYIEDIDPEIRRYAAESIAQMNPGKDLSSFITAAEEEDISTRKDIALMFFSEYFVEKPDVSKQKPSVSLPEKYRAYMEMLESKEPSTREEALILLAQTGDRSINSLFVDFLRDDNEMVAVKAMDIIVELKELKATDSIIELLSSHKSILRQKAAWALGELGDSRALNPLLEILHHKDEGTRASSAYALGNLGDKRAIKVLLDMVIEDNDPEARSNAAESLVQLDNSRDLSCLIEIAGDDNPTSRKRAVLESFSPEEFIQDTGIDSTIEEKMKPYLQALQSNNSKMRKDACRALANMKLPESVPYLIEALKDSDENVCRAAGYALARFPSAINPLISLLNYPNFLTVQMAIWALGELKAREATLPLIDLLFSKDSGIRESVAHSLGHIDDERALESLRNCLLVDKNRDVRIYAGEAIGKIKKIKDINRLRDIAKSDDDFLRRQEVNKLFPEGKTPVSHSPVRSDFVDEDVSIPESEQLESPDPNIRRGTISLLSEKYGLNALSYIAPYLRDPDEGVRDTSIIALVEIGAVSVADKIIPCIKDPSPVICQRAIWALGELKAKEAIPVLINLLSTHDPAIRACSAYALGNMGDERVVDSLCNSMLTDEDPQVRIYSAESLGQIKNKKASKVDL